MKPIEQVRQMIAELIGSPDMHFMERRAQTERFAAAFEPPADIRYEAGLLGGVAAEWIIPDGVSKARIFLHFHGGGYVLGNPAGSRVFTTAFARAADAAVVSVNYRIAPEHPYPAAVEDAVAAYRALLDAGAAPHAIAAGGESAGGGLAAAMLLAARDAGLAMPACAILVSPWLDLTCSAGTFDTKAGADPLLSRRSLQAMAEAYLAGADPRAPYASPIFADLSGLPPLLIQVGSEEVLLDDSIAFERQAARHGVATHLTVWNDMIHVWPMFHPLLPEASAAIAAAADFARKAWTGPAQRARQTVS